MDSYSPSRYVYRYFVKFVFDVKITNIWLIMIIQSEMDDHENVDTVELIQCEDGDDQIAREDDEVMPSSHWFTFEPIRNKKSKPIFKPVI